MTRTELEILLRRYLAQAKPGEYLNVDCGPGFVQSVREGDAMLVEVRGDLGPELWRRIEGLFANYRLDGGSAAASAGCVDLAFAAGDAGVAEAMAGALDLIAAATGRPLRLADGDGAFMPKRTGFLGMGGYGPIVDPE